jgi:hypothetical protein
VTTSTLRAIALVGREYTLANSFFVTSFTQILESTVQGNIQ